MKASSPVRSMASCYQAVCCLSEQSLSIARSSSHKGSEETMGLLYDTNDCYSKLQELVPGIPQGSKLSQVEILQHVIDYIFDLQILLGEEQNSSILSLQILDFSEMTTKRDASSICHGPCQQPWCGKKKNNTSFHETTDLKMEEFNSFSNKEKFIILSHKKTSHKIPQNSLKLQSKTKLLIPMSTFFYSTAECCNTHRPNV
ncbi:DNA-binding protein inhibitor ID-3-A-like [Hyla sarda]|uniref:DNA-binding protein inhibitor ID-3-A-like n=1 Tax=Hyla sarda TaxID=327740 RepID=UPI0024C32ACF|nr:DNA-binding protein inhibitor ID-3-A-like [Hyla sarda]